MKPQNILLDHPKFSHTTITLDPHLTVITGASGAGKTLLLDYLQNKIPKSDRCLQDRVDPDLEAFKDTAGIFEWPQYLNTSSFRLLQLLTALKSCVSETIFVQYPDACIGWEDQKAVFPLLRHFYPNKRFIVETQSLVLLGRLQPSQVISLVKTQDKFQILPVTKSLRVQSFQELAETFYLMTGSLAPNSLRDAYNNYRFYGRQTKTNLTEDQKAQLQESKRIILEVYHEELPFEEVQ